MPAEKVPHLEDDAWFFCRYLHLLHHNSRYLSALYPRTNESVEADHSNCSNCQED